jgi:hypothetical protein
VGHTIEIYFVGNMDKESFGCEYIEVEDLRKMVEEVNSLINACKK